MEKISKFNKHRAFDKAVGPEKKSKINKRRAYIYRVVTYTEYGPISKLGVRGRGDAAVGYRTILCMPILCLPILLNNGTTFTAYPNLLRSKFLQ